MSHLCGNAEDSEGFTDCPAALCRLTFRVERYKHSASRYCSAVDLEIWALTFLPVCVDKWRDFLSSFKSLFVRIAALLC